MKTKNLFIFLLLQCLFLVGCSNEPEVPPTDTGNDNKMKIAITNSETVFEKLVFEGSNVTGTVNWGDGTESTITQGHTFSSSTPRTSTFEIEGAESFRINSLNSISSIIIYCEE